MDEKLFDEGVDYRKMYYHMSGAVESAIRILIAAQQKCEDILLDSADEAEASVPEEKLQT